MEEHRLVPMPKRFNEAVFHDIYQKTAELRYKLATQIDHRRYGVEREDVLSWFDVKFIFAFTKYHKEKPEILKAYIINALQFFKNRILRYSYSQKNSVNLNKLDIEETYNRKETQFEPDYDESGYFLELAISYLKEHLTSTSYKILLVELNPPPYILKRLKNKETTTKIPSKLIAEYLGLEDVEVFRAQKEIQLKTQQANIYFSLPSNYN